MKAVKSIYVCRECGTTSPKWLGKCPGCAGWNTLEEERALSKTDRDRASAGIPKLGREPARPLREVSTSDAERISTGIGELDRVLGGGAVAGGVVLIGGDPGIGKSTLLLQALAAVAHGGKKALYVSGEESASQLALRAERLGLKGAGDIIVLCTTDLEDVERAMEAVNPDIAVIDSVQTLRSNTLESAAGTVSQLREVTARLIERVKSRGTALFLIGHVTKEGTIAGPKVLEHMVDAVLTFEGDTTHAYRLVRATKNRFGPAHEMGVFEMISDGLREVPEPSAMFLGERATGVPGSVVTANAEGSRPLLLEVQALVAPASYGSSRRVVTGFDSNRLAILLAVIERKALVQVLDRDAFVSIIGGARVNEPAVDLAVAVALVSSLREKPMAAGTVILGEVGLTGEVRSVPRPGLRVDEARKFGFTHVVLPQGNAERLTPAERKDMQISGVRSLAEALLVVFS